MAINNPNTPNSSSQAQDTALSRRRHGFKSRIRYSIPRHVARAACRFGGESGLIPFSIVMPGERSCDMLPSFTIDDFSQSRFGDGYPESGDQFVEDCFGRQTIRLSVAGKPDGGCRHSRLSMPFALCVGDRHSPLRPTVADVIRSRPQNQMVGPNARPGVAGVSNFLPVRNGRAVMDDSPRHDVGIDLAAVDFESSVASALASPGPGPTDLRGFIPSGLRPKTRENLIVNTQGHRGRRHATGASGQKGR